MSAYVENVYLFVLVVDREARTIALTQTNLVLILSTTEFRVLHITGVFRRCFRVLPAIHYGHIISMAIATIRSTYALRIETVRQLELLAKRWGVSKSEALRRAISEAALHLTTDAHLTPAEALDRLQTTDGMPAQKASEFASQVRRERSEYKRIIK